MTNGKKTISLKMNSRIIVDDFEAAKVFITQGDGIGILPNIICKKEEMTDQFIKVLPSWSLSLGPNRKGVIYIVYPPQKYMPPKIKSFIDLALS